MSSSLKPTVPVGGDEDRGVYLEAGLWTFACLATLAQMMRLFCRLRMRQLGWDDHWMFFSTAVFIATAATATVYTENGGGRHLYYLSQEGGDKVAQVTLLNWVLQTLEILNLGFGKTSAALLIMRFLTSEQRWHRIFLWFAVFSVNLLLILTCIINFVQCDPPKKVWDQRVPGKCWPPLRQVYFSIFVGAYSSAMDILIALLPCTFLFPLQITKQKKVFLCTLFGLGVIAGICGAYKTSQILGIASRGDFTWDSFGALIWTAVEQFLIIMCGTLPTLKPLWDRVSRSSTTDSDAFYSEYSKSYGRRDDTHALARPRADSVMSNSASAGPARSLVGGRSWFINAKETTLGSQDIMIERTVDVSYSRHSMANSFSD